MEHADATILGVLSSPSASPSRSRCTRSATWCPAKRFGVRVTQYMVGFGPTMWSGARGETEYGVKAIPLGGYIRMIGMFPPKPGDPAGPCCARRPPAGSRS